MSFINKASPNQVFKIFLSHWLKSFLKNATNILWKFRKDLLFINQIFTGLFNHNGFLSLFSLFIYLFSFSRFPIFDLSLVTWKEYFSWSWYTWLRLWLLRVLFLLLSLLRLAWLWFLLLLLLFKRFESNFLLDDSLIGYFTEYFIILLISLSYQWIYYLGFLSFSFVLINCCLSKDQEYYKCKYQ